MTRDWTHNLGISRWCSSQLSYLGRGPWNCCSLLLFTLLRGLWERQETKWDDAGIPFSEQQPRSAGRSKNCNEIYQDLSNLSNSNLSHYYLLKEDFPDHTIKRNSSSHSLIIVGVQNEPPWNVPLRHAHYLDLRAVKIQQTQTKTKTPTPQAVTSLIT